MNGFKDLPYPERLRRLNLPTLRFRRMRGDVIEVYKNLTNCYDQTVSLNLKRASSSTRGHSMKLFQERSRLDIRKHSFRNRIVSVWNSLPEEVVTAPTLNSFKNRLDRHWKSHPMLYDPFPIGEQVGLMAA